MKFFQDSLISPILTVRGFFLFCFSFCCCCSVKSLSEPSVNTYFHIKKLFANTEIEKEMFLNIGVNQNFFFFSFIIFHIQHCTTMKEWLMIFQEFFFFLVKYLQQSLYGHLTIAVQCIIIIIMWSVSLVTSHSSFYISNLSNYFKKFTSLWIKKNLKRSWLPAFWKKIKTHKRLKEHFWSLWFAFAWLLHVSYSGTLFMTDWVRWNCAKITWFK